MKKQEIILGLRNNRFFIKEQTGIKPGCGDVCPSLGLYSVGSPELRRGRGILFIRGEYNSCDLKSIFNYDDDDANDIVKSIEVFNSGALDNKKIINVIREAEDDDTITYSLYSKWDSILDCPNSVYEEIRRRITAANSAKRIVYDGGVITISNDFKPMEYVMRKKNEECFIRNVSILNALWKKRGENEEGSNDILMPLSTF